MLSKPSIDQTNLPQKALALGLLIATIFGGIWLFNNYLAPFFIDFFVNVWKLVLIGGPLLMIGLYIISNPLIVWGFFKTLSWNFTKFLIKFDPLSVMDRYADLLGKKLVSLQKIKVQLEGRYIKSCRKISELEKLRDDNLKRGRAALTQKDEHAASLAGTRARGADESIRLYKPNNDRMKRSIDFLNLLSQNWETSQIKLREEIARKREEFEVLRDDAKALNQAESFINGDTEEGRIYQESIKALEESVGQKIAYIEDFERRSKDIMAGIKIDNQVQKDEGIKMLEEYMNGGQLMMPQDFNEEVQYATVLSTSAPKFNLLNKNKNN